MIVPGSVNPLLMMRTGDPLDELGKIERSIRFRSSATVYLGKTFAGAGSNVWTFNGWIKRADFGAYQGIFTRSVIAAGVWFNPSNQLELINGAAHVASTAVFRDPTAHLNLHVTSDGTTVVAKVNGVQVVSYTGVLGGVNTANPHTICGYLATGEYLGGYASNMAFVDGQVVAETAFGQFHSRTGQWRPKSRSVIKAVVDAGGANSFFLPFDDTTNLTTLVADASTKGNNWTANNISLTAGATYDSMQDTPTNNFATLNLLAPGAANISDAGLKSGATPVQATQDCSRFASCWEVTAAGSNVTAGVLSPYGAASTVTVLANKTFGFEYSGGTLRYRNVTDAGAWTTGATGLTREQFPYGTGAAATWNFGQQAFVGTFEAGYSALCTKNLGAPAVARSTTAHVAVTDTGANIAATLAAARSGWSGYIDIIKRRDAAEGWRWLFSDDAGYFMDMGITATARTAVPAFGGTSYVGYSLKVSAANGVATGRLVHVNGVADTVIDGLAHGRKMILLKNEASGTCYVHHPELTSGKLLYLDTTAAETTDATISAVTASGFTVAAALASGTYRWVALAETEGFLKLFKYTGNASADGPSVYFGLSPAMLFVKNTSAGKIWLDLDSARRSYNLNDLKLSPGTTDPENGGGMGGAGINAADLVSNGIKIRNNASEINQSSLIHVGIAFAAFPFRYANAR